ncbi:MBOAT family O-acyltransferase [Paenibacillus sp. YIM B09110]|uniref:MBOAT family O-acyltransferase n=1 Tax=Paenibacillus sp. YIM B09110 TaxID=3126102 RepID=UPI00301D3AED
MVFSTYTFILMFLPITFFGYRVLSLLKNSFYGKLWLVLASLYFYAQGSGKFIGIFIAIVLFNYFVGTMIVRAKESGRGFLAGLMLTIGLIQNVGCLGYYKYTNFFLENVNAALGRPYTLMEIALPLGISFFTFQLIAYLVDCYRGKVDEFSFINFLVFTTFFPQLVVGPIVHHGEIIPQLEEKSQRLFNKDNFMLGLFLFSIGAAKKVSLADPLTTFAQGYYANIAAGDFYTAWIAVLAYTISYYFDLSGYADMAIGLGLMFNVKLPENFNSPYKARNFREYWQRWHMTLSRFLSDYIFRGVYKRGSGSFNFYSAVMVTFLVSGIWHGAGWQFVIWGVLNGVFVCASHFMSRNKLAMPFAIAWTLTFAGVVGTRILFVSDDIGQTMDVIRMLFDFHQFAGLGLKEIFTDTVTYAAYHLYTIVLLIVASCIAFFFKNTGEIKQNFKPNFKYALASALLLGLALSQMEEVSDFLYFQF